MFITKDKKTKNEIDKAKQLYLEFIKQFVKLPKLKKEYIFGIDDSGGVNICLKKGGYFQRVLYSKFLYIIEDSLAHSLETYEKYLEKPKYKTIEVLEGWE